MHPGKPRGLLTPLRWATLRHLLYWQWLPNRVLFCVLNFPKWKDFIQRHQDQTWKIPEVPWGIERKVGQTWAGGLGTGSARPHPADSLQSAPFITPSGIVFSQRANLSKGYIRLPDFYIGGINSNSRTNCMGPNKKPCPRQPISY